MKMQRARGIDGENTVGRGVGVSTREHNGQGIQQSLHTARNSFREDRFSDIEVIIGWRRDTRKGSEAVEQKLGQQGGERKGLMRRPGRKR
jgi:hypothetical protein